MSISIIYRVSVVIPDDVVQAHYGNHSTTTRYDRLLLAATKGCLAAGSNHYNELEEWAEFDSGEAARCCDRNIYRMVETLRKEPPCKS